MAIYKVTYLKQDYFYETETVKAEVTQDELIKLLQRSDTSVEVALKIHQGEWPWMKDLFKVIKDPY
ncbi:hypothetical protein SPSYN_02012 [Sporotomaculum syntrophicum]|uniref:Uncharacterized protein n=1 Tax=Sporotomaculum syntrophicum TaxID=182264 RepID=A0A9D2WNR1_9FIRM|nr:hypothetical protein [Sporotomaculum syntrophicum]KAF1084842.1 hypothetical protein SPSYN_02012 [Sporotomaculum syntrophicum]